MQAIKIGRNVMKRGSYNQLKLYSYLTPLRLKYDKEGNGSIKKQEAKKIIKKIMKKAQVVDKEMDYDFMSVLGALDESK